MTKETKDLSKNIKKLTPMDLKKEGKKLDAQEEFFITIGDTEYKLTHDVYFRKTKQRDLLEDMLEFFNSIEQANVDVLEMATPYTALLIIKHFTSLEVPDDVEGALEYLSLLIDLDILGTIVNALPEGEVLKTYELLKQTVENVKDNFEEAELEATRLSDEVENKEILKTEEEFTEVDLQIEQEQEEFDKQLEAENNGEEDGK